MCSRTFTRVYSKNVASRINKGISEALGLMKNDCSEISLPAIAKNYRYFDLLNGNDIPIFLKKIHSIRERLGEFSKDESILFSEFATFVRVPTKIYTESSISHGLYLEDKGCIFEDVINISIRTDIKIKDFQGILDEFILEYCTKRMNFLEKNPEAGSDDLPRKLRTEVLRRGTFDVPNAVVDRHDSFIGYLVGLYSWDKLQENKNITSSGIAQKLSNECNITRDDSAIRKDLKKTSDEIENLIYGRKKS